MLAVAKTNASVNTELLTLLDDLNMPMHMIGPIADLAGSVLGLRSLASEQLESIGLSKKASRVLLAAGKIARAASERERLDKPSNAVSFIRSRVDIAALEVEHAWVITLDARTQAIALFEIAVGSVARVDMHPREVFKAAIRTSAHSIILLHNHPSGRPGPSESDIQLTVRLAEAGHMLGIPLLDHIVLTATEHRSLAILGLMPDSY